VEPALRACIVKAGGSAAALEFTFGDGGLAAAINDQPLLDQLLCRLAQRIPDAVHSSIDTLREMGQWIADQRPTRLIPPAKKGLRGEARRSRGAIEFSAYTDWPYCEHCGQLSELADAICRLGRMPPHLRQGRAPSPRFCAQHHPTINQAVARRRTYFKQVLRAIKRELTSDKVFRAQFAKMAWQWEEQRAGAKELRLEEVMTFAVEVRHAPLITDPIKSYARECAYQIARHHADDTELAIARLRAEGLIQSEIARRLDLSRQAVSLRMRKTSGHYDFSRSSPLLYWWPGEAPAFSGQSEVLPPSRLETPSVHHAICNPKASDYRSVNIGMRP